MRKKLRICLAMGGGVSLGSFSGSALTESLKLLVLYGKDRDNNPYDEIIIDGMSGASAGAVAMTILLRCLMDYKSMLALYNDTLSENHLVKELANAYFDSNVEHTSKHPKIEQLKALQLAQKIQHKIWVDELDSLKLYGNKIHKDYHYKKNDAFGLLDRKLLENLTKKYLITKNEINLTNKQLLDDNRVIFVCSLTNLLPIEILYSSHKTNQLKENLLKSTGSQNHSELRVIDFIFNNKVLNKKDTDSCWLQFSSDPKKDNETHFNINSKEAWATLGASALACAAFPIAFEPVMLKRFKDEFGFDKYSQWPKSFNAMEEVIHKGMNTYENFKINSFFNEYSNEKIVYDKFNFPYIDGGTFNNEPIKEGFKIGAFQDFGRIIEDEERLILFVDPLVREDYNHSFKVPSYSPIKSSKDTYKFNTEFSKLFGSLSSIVNVLRNQGSIKEEHRIRGVKENLSLRETIFNYLETNQVIGDTLTTEVLKTAFDKVNSNLASASFSLGTRDPIQYFIWEIEKTCYQNHDLCIPIAYDALYKVKENIDTMKSISDVYTTLELTSNSDKNNFAQTVFRLIIDFSLNTDGKSEDAMHAAILPINKELETIDLPGSEIEAFAGFASRKSRDYAFEYGKLSTIITLKQQNQGFRKEPLITGDNLDRIEANIEEKIKRIDFFSDRNTFKENLRNNLFITSFKRIKGILLTNKFIAFILLKSPFIITSLFGVLSPLFGIYQAVKSIFTKSPWNGSNIIDNFINQQSNSVKFISLTPVTLSILSDKPLPKKILIQCKSEKKLKKIMSIENKFKNATHKERYQYLFTFYLLKYTKLNTKIERLGFSLDDKVTMPYIDGNLNPMERRNQIEKNYRNEIEAIRIGKIGFPTLIDDINNEATTLNHSIKNINYHVNPIVEFDIQKFNEGWYFVEKTESLDKKMLREL